MQRRVTDKREQLKKRPTEDELSDLINADIPQVLAEDDDSAADEAPADPERAPDDAPKPQRAQSFKIVAYVYPNRNPRYAHVVQNFPPSGNQAVIKVLLAEGWREARDVMDAYLRQDVAWIQAWRRNKPLPRPKEGPMAVLPILDLNRDYTKHRYVIQLRPDKNQLHREIAAYYASLETSEQKQTFLRIALVIGAERPDIESKVAGLRL